MQMAYWSPLRGGHDGGMMGVLNQQKAIQKINECRMKNEECSYGGDSWEVVGVASVSDSGGAVHAHKY